MKKRIAVVMVCLAIAALTISGSLAYFTADSTATNVITSGNLDIQLNEKTADGSDFEDVDGVMPGDVISKIVTVENRGESDAYVRIQMNKTITLAGNPDGKVDLSLIYCDINEVDWEKDGDYYYYKHPLKPGKSTSPLFTYVEFKKEMGNLYQNCKATIDVKAQAVQVKNNGNSAKNAAGWSSDAE